MGWFYDFIIYVFTNYRIEIFQLLALLLLYIFRNELEELADKIKAYLKDNAIRFVVLLIFMFALLTIDDPLPFQWVVLVLSGLYLFVKPISKGGKYVYEKKISV